MLTALAGALLPVFLLMLLGVVLGKKTSYLDSPSLSALTSNIGVPALLLHSVLTMDMQVGEMGMLIGATIAMLAVSCALTLLFLRVYGESPRFYLPPLVNPNTGNMGIPVCFALFGQEGVALAIVISSVVQISHFTLGVGVMSGSYSPKALAKNGPVMALLLGALLLWLDIQLPAPLMKTLDMLGGITLPIMLMLLGYSVSRLSFSDGRSLQKPLVFSVARPLIGVLAAWLVILVLPLSTFEQQVLMVQGAMPVAVISYILTSRYEGPTDDVALMILASIPVSFVVAGTIWWLG